MVREALTDLTRLKRYAAAGLLIAVALSLVPLAAWAARNWRAHHQLVQAARHLPYPRLDFPLQISGSQYIPVSFADIPGWTEDDHLAAYKTFRTSCRPITAQPPQTTDDKALGGSLRDPCRLARETEILQPGLVLAVGTLAIEQVLQTKEKLNDLIGTVRRAEYHGVACDVIALPHPSGASPWHKMEPGKTLLRKALAQIAAHPEVQRVFGARSTTG